MMRCVCCNNPLNDYESTNKDVGGRYLDTCSLCLDGLGVAQLGRPDLNPDEEISDEGHDEYIDDPYEDEDYWNER